MTKEPLYCNEDCKWLEWDDQSCSLFKQRTKFEERMPCHSIFIQRCKGCKQSEANQVHRETKRKIALIEVAHERASRSKLQFDSTIR